MCTAISDRGQYHLFGRTLDLERSFGEAVAVAPRGFVFPFLAEEKPLAMIGVAHVSRGVPLYYDAVNEAGLAAAALNFSGNAVYFPPRAGKQNIPSFALIPFLLRRCRDLSSARERLAEVNVTPKRFDPSLPATPLHWLVADRQGALVVEQTAAGLSLYENPVGVLTNDPPFPYQMTHLADFMHTGPRPPENNLCPGVELPHYARGMGSLGLPGDFTSPARFVRAVYAKAHTVCGEGEGEAVSRFFHIMETVSQPRGCAVTEEGRPIETVYTSCANAETGTYYVTTYACRRPFAVRLHAAPLAGRELITYPFPQEEDVLVLNG